MADGALFILPVTIDATDRGRRAGAGRVQGAALHAPARRRGDAEFAQRLRDFMRARQS